ncbi:Crp/Fnr family transcriptional regulator [Olivibacter sp. SDN3]|uniref:Crp/Fnr family transcriptional regulator n=1 Tax=Olivibacter sp. SDN3 TaxID=2764720 RepID=UPI001650FCFA|nr:Crp/Fnr family transcriptional regulator [Olivibacter sp. SDN3]QNL48103.1 Crp/Fnr family transcriptional regulator [Olivibacter sp. SDN3]
MKSAFDRIISLDEQEWSVVKSAFKMLQVSPKQLLTSIGEVEKKIYFVAQGLMRLYCMNVRDEETTIFLFRENHFASCYQSFLTQFPSDQALETLENCTLFYITKERYDWLHKEVPKMNIVTRVIAEQRFINAQRIFSSHIMHSPEQRYLEFERQHGDLLLSVPHHIIASFLGVTPVSLSRIRNRVSRK